MNPAAANPAAQATDPAATRREAQMRQAAEAFEAVFLRQVIGSMRQAKIGEDLFGSSASDQFRDMADARLADDMAARGSFGIAELLLQQFGRGGTSPDGGTNDGGSR
ncbi:rod-binding protein [Sphingosinicella sp. YJ22]|uniref:rod-binding protein n=1 Tax=Sphingosinicella sp. YJ22 TaxID=1104780 RepID=UPI001FAFFF18|nr:rod-binding protein [Sphingosinicella sp. YJ22]